MSTSRQAFPSRTAVLVLNYNGWQDTIACLESLLRQDRPVGIFVVDNRSTNDSAERLRAWCRDVLPTRRAAWSPGGPVPFAEYAATPDGGPDPELGRNGGTFGSIVLIRTARNLGYAGGNNVGMRFALAEDYDSVWVLNNDTEVRPDALSRLADRMAEDAAIGFCGSTLLYFDRPDTIQNLGGGRFRASKGRGEALGMGLPARLPPSRQEVEAELAFVSGASMLVRREVMETIGLMEEGYFLFWEELDWAFRASGRWRLAFAPASVVLHKVGASIGTRDEAEQSELAEFYMVRNRILFCRRFSRRSLPFVAADIARRLFRLAVSGRWRRIRLLAGAALGRHLVDGRPVRTR